MFSNIQNQKQTNDLNSVRNVFNLVYNIQNLPDLHSLIKNNQLLFTSFIDQLRNPPLPDPRVTLPQESEVFRKKAHRVAARNQKFKEQILLIRTKLMQDLNIYDSSFTENYEEIRAVEKIKELNTEIKRKILALKQKRNDQKQIESDYPQLNEKRKLEEQKMRPINVKIDEMGQGAEFMNKQLINLKYDMEITAKYFKSYSEPARDQESKRKYI